MSAVAIALIIFACVFCGALVGLLLQRTLPAHHLSDSTKDVVKLGMGLVATMSALVLGLLIASAKASYEAQKSGFEELSANLLLLDGALAEYGPEAKDARDSLRLIVASVVERIWPKNPSQASGLGAKETTTKGRMLYQKIQNLSPRDDAQRRLQAQALGIVTDLGRTRWLLLGEQESSSIPAAFLVVLAFWLVVLFASFGLFAPANMTVVATLFLCALSASGAIFLVLEMDRPFDGLIQISSVPLREALAHLGQ